MGIFRVIILSTMWESQRGCFEAIILHVGCMDQDIYIFENVVQSTTWGSGHGQLLGALFSSAHIAPCAPGSQTLQGLTGTKSVCLQEPTGSPSPSTLSLGLCLFLPESP